MLDEPSSGDLWQSGNAYEPYVGRWSRLVAPRFLDWLAARPESRWVDVGCGTGALTHAIVENEQPRSVLGIDRSEGFISFAREHVRDTRATFETGNAQALPAESDSCDAVVCGLVLNFVPRPISAVLEFRRVLRPGGVAGAYVWDYVGEMQMMRYFWDAAITLDPGAAELDEGRRCNICQPEPLGDLFRVAGFRQVEVIAIDVATVFADFDDYWTPFLRGQAPAPAYAVSLSAARRETLREQIRRSLPPRDDGSIHLVARAWAVKGRT